MQPIPILLINHPELSFESVSDQPIRVDRVADAAAAAEAARSKEYRMVLARLPVDGRPPKDLVYFLRHAPGTRCRAASIIAIVPPRQLALVHAAITGGMKEDYLTDPVCPEALARLIAKYGNPPARREVRLMLRAKVDLPLENRPFFGQSLNMSRNGLLMTSDRELPMGAPLEMTFNLPGDNLPLKAHSVVAREAGERRAKGRAYGVQFTHVEPRDHTRLEAFLDD